MALTLEEVRRIASLARLRLSRQEERLFVAQLGAVVDYFAQLRDYPTAEPEVGAAAAPEAADRPAAGLRREAFLANAPAALGPFLLVPEVKAED